MSVLSVGHPTVDLFLGLEKAHLHRVDLDREELCLPFPDKIHVDDLNVSPGGNAANTAAGLKAMGIDVSLYAHRSEDVPGMMLDQHFETLNIPIVSGLTKEKSDLSVILSHSSDRVILSHHAPADWSWSPPENFPFDWLYLSSLGTSEFAEFHDSLKQYLREHPDIKCAYNPGSSELEKQAEDLNILEEIDILIVNREEAGELLNRKVSNSSDGKIRELAIELSRKGPETVVITDGTNGSWAWVSDGFYFHPVFPTDVVESTGAGDSFAAGFVGATVKGKSLPDALSWGTALSHSVLGVTGATEGLVSDKEIQQIVEQFEAFNPEKL